MKSFFSMFGNEGESLFRKFRQIDLTVKRERDNFFNYDLKTSVCTSPQVSGPTSQMSRGKSRAALFLSQVVGPAGAVLGSDDAHGSVGEVKEALAYAHESARANAGQGVK